MSEQLLKERVESEERTKIKRRKKNNETRVSEEFSI